jgi:hypothetical protein
VLDEARAFLAFLDDAGLLDPESDDPACSRTMLMP